MRSGDTTGVLGMAPRHKRSASFCILNEGFNILGEEKKYASMPYSITDLTSDLQIVSSGPHPKKCLLIYE